MIARRAPMNLDMTRPTAAAGAAPGCPRATLAPPKSVSGAMPEPGKASAVIAVARGIALTMVPGNLLPPAITPRPALGAPTVAVKSP